MIIGLTGENCSGKGTVADYLGKKGFVYLSLSDVIREELKKDNREITRDTLLVKGNELRKLDPAYLAKTIVLLLKDDRNYIIDSIRNPYEAEELKKEKNFFLIYVTAPAQLRFERMTTRNRENDPKTYKDFLHIEDAERKNADLKKQNIEETAKLADSTIVNDGDFARLYDDINHILSRLSSSGEFMTDRPSWDEYFMNIASVVSTRSNCIKRKVAGVIVKDRRIISTGYNGTPRGVKNCNEGGCQRCNNFEESGKNLADCVCSHGEENAIVQAAYHGITIKDATMYSTYSPCLLCTKMIINAGIGEVVYNAEYPLAQQSNKLLKEAGIVVRNFTANKK